MKYNPGEVALLQPDYLGFIFYDKSPRFFEGSIPEIPQGIGKVGVFVNATPEEISKKIKEYDLDVIQLHGEETPRFCKKLFAQCQTESADVELPALSGVEVWKVFGIKDSFDFKQLKPYEKVVDKFLFDTQGKEKGGNGYTFNWNVLKEYPSKKPFILSGGIGLTEIEELKKIVQTKLPIYAIDVNSKFEIKPGLKNIQNLRKFSALLQDFIP
jgi:phosphoribosylanthranilate isomerase